MAIDIYTGPFCRYYAGVWENEAQRIMRQDGVNYTIIRPTCNKEDQETSIPPIDIEEICSSWLGELSRGFNIPFELQESLEIPYLTNRFNEFSDFYNASCYIYDEQKDIEPFLAGNIDKRFIKSIEKDHFVYFGNIWTWIPVDLPGTGIFEITFPNDEKKLIASTKSLITELEKISIRLANKKLNDINITNVNAEDSEDILNLIGLPTFYKHALYSLEKKVPTILDY